MEPLKLELMHASRGAKYDEIFIKYFRQISHAKIYLFNELLRQNILLLLRSSDRIKIIIVIAQFKKLLS